MTWELSAEAYKDLIQATDWDSKFLREEGLVPNILELLGDCENVVLLDAGTGTGWLFNYIRPAQAYACDIVAPPTVPEGVNFERQRVESLSYGDNTFDVIIASLLLIYCEDIQQVCAEFHRVAKKEHGRLIVSLVHPYFYRTGEVTDNEKFLITRDLSRPFEIPLKIAEQVGPVTYFYRPLPDYVNTLLETGWIIRSMRDWFIDMEHYQQVIQAGMKTKLRRTGRIPLFTFIDCRSS